MVGTLCLERVTEQLVLKVGQVLPLDPLLLLLALLVIEVRRVRRLLSRSGGGGREGEGVALGVLAGEEDAEEEGGDCSTNGEGKKGGSGESVRGSERREEERRTANDAEGNVERDPSRAVLDGLLVDKDGVRADDVTYEVAVSVLH